jgi:uncharacterized membrane protein
MKSRKLKPKDSRERSSATDRDSLVPTAPLPEHMSQSIEAIIELHARHEKDVSRNQRIVENVANFFGRPAFLSSVLLVITLWITPNILPRRFGLPRFDPPPFPWLQLTLATSSLLMTTGVLIRQNRQEKLAEQRAQLTLQLNLLSEQKIAKLIALVEELRSDLPNVKNRYDPEAETMQEAADPQVVVTALEDTLTQELKNLQK